MVRASDNLLRKSDVNESLHCSLEACSAGVVGFQFQWPPSIWQTHRHHDWDKHLACWIHRLVCARHRQTHLMNIFWMYSINLVLFRCHTRPPLILLHRSPLVNSSAWGLVMPRPFARVGARIQHQILKQISIVDLPRILLVLSRLWPTQVRFSGTEPAISPAVFLWSSSSNGSRSTFRIVSTNIGLHVFNNVASSNFSQVSCARSSSSSPRLFWFSNCWKALVPHVFTRFWSYL